VRDLLGRAGVEILEMSGASCCAPQHLFGVSKAGWLALNKRNLSLAGGEILTACDECFASLQDARVSLADEGLPGVKPLVTLISENEEALRGMTKGLDLRCAVQHSCHLLRPSKVRKVDEPEKPMLLRAALDAIGCTSIPHTEELSCCGGQILGSSQPGEKLARRKIASALEAGADCIVTTCAHCLRHLSRHSTKLPVLHLSQLYAVALGSEPSKIGVSGDLVRRR